MQQETHHTKEEAANSVNSSTSPPAADPMDSIVVPAMGIMDVRDNLQQLAGVSFMMAELTSDAHQKESSPYAILNSYFMRAHQSLIKASLDLGHALERSRAL